jgi:acetolactate synthase I/II/III large subunit
MGPAKQTYRVADYLMSRLAELGVRDVFFLPGGGAMYLDDALVCEKRITPVPCHHEQACGIAAEANGRTSEAGFGVALVTTGPGATNVLTPVAGAWIESLPLMVISGQVKRPDSLRGRALRQSGVQEVDIISMVKPVTKFAVTIQNPEDIRRCFEEAVWHMRSGRPGPVWLDVPLDVQAAPIDTGSLVGFQVPSDSESTDDFSHAMAKLETLLAKAKRPIILAGHGVRIAGGEHVFRQLVEKLGIPCVFTWNAADLLPWPHPLYVGRPGVVAARAPNFAVQNCDCLISIGCRLDNIITAYNPKGFARAATKIVVDIDANELARHEMEVDLKVCADARAFLEAWACQVAPAGDWQAWRERCLGWKTRYTPLDGRTFSGDGPISHFQFADALSDAIPENSLVITGSSGLAVEVVYTVFRNKAGQRMFLTSGLGSMGYGLSAAIGACIGAGRVPTVCVESDGSLMLNLQELATLKALDLPIVLVIMNNNGYASIRNTQRNYFAGRYLGTGPDSGLFIPDFVEVGRSIGLNASRISTSAELATGLAQALAQHGPSICEVRLQNDELLSPKVAAIPQSDGSMLSMPLEDMSPLLPLEQLQSEMIVGLDERSRVVNRGN